MPLSRSLKQKTRGSNKSAAAPVGDARPGNAITKKSGTERPDPAKDAPQGAAPQAKVIRTNS